MMGWSHDIWQVIFGQGSEMARQLTVLTTILSVFALDTALNALMACCRCLIVDCLPAEKQKMAQAYASQVGGACSLLSYFLGTTDVHSTFPWLAESQFKIVLMYSAFASMFGAVLTCWAVEERVLVSRGKDDKRQDIFVILSKILRTAQTLPPRIRSICFSQMMVWNGWFPFYFYTSTWVGEIYARSLPGQTLTADDKSRAGSFAMTLLSIVSMASTIILPRLTADSGKRAIENGCKPTLAWLWGVSEIVFGVSLIATLYIEQLWAAYVVVCVAGFCSCISHWAPFTLLGEEIQYLGGGRARRPSDVPHAYDAVRVVDEEEMVDDVNVSFNSTTPLGPGFERPASARSTALAPPPNASASRSDESGSILGIHNIAVCIPQFIITFVSSIVFKLLDPATSVEDAAEPAAAAAATEGAPTNAASIPVVFAIGGFFAILAGITTLRRL